MKFCSKCIMPETRPDQYLDSNYICNGCKSYQNLKKIDWKKRKANLYEIIKKLKLDKKKWNCVIPTSGGKDSTYQAIKAKEIGLNPVLVNARTCDLSDIGRQNIENQKKIGFDVVEISTNKDVRSNLNRIGLRTLGDISWPEHVSIFTVPVRFALNYKIPLILWGENPQVQYGGPKETLKNNILDRNWMEEFGGLLGFRVSDLNLFGVENKDLNIFNYPSNEELKKFPVLGIFLSHYFQWDDENNYNVAKKNGFKKYEKKLEGCYFQYAKIDNYQHGIHDYFKYLKYGFGRATDQLCYLIRKGKISREKAIKIAKKTEGKFLKSYMGKDIKNILGEIGISQKEYIEICDKFTNKKIFKCDKNGKLIKDKSNNLIRIWNP